MLSKNIGGGGLSPRIFLLAVLALSVLLLSLPCAVFALEIFEGKNISIDERVDDDIFAAGTIINVNEPVGGAIIAGGTVNINAPIAGDLLVIGGEVNINSDIYGKIVAVGGRVNLRSAVETNAVLAGGKIIIFPEAYIGRDALISAVSTTHQGLINGTLHIKAGNLIDEGVSGEVIVEQPRDVSAVKLAMNLLNALLIISFYIIGLLLTLAWPAAYRKVDIAISEKPIKSFLLGFVSLIISPFIIVLFILSIIGIPVAFILAVSFVIGLMAAVLFVSYSAGKWLFGMLGIEAHRAILFTAGFILLNLIFRLPLLGSWAVLISVILGYGAIAYSLRQKPKKRRFWGELR
jgi:hypothetical protein